MRTELAEMAEALSAEDIKFICIFCEGLYLRKAAKHIGCSECTERMHRDICDTCARLMGDIFKAQMYRRKSRLRIET